MENKIRKVVLLYLKNTDLISSTQLNLKKQLFWRKQQSNKFAFELCIQ